MESKELKQLFEKQTAETNKHYKVISGRLDGLDVKLSGRLDGLDVKIQEQAEEAERHQKILLEEFEGRLVIIAESQMSLVKKVDAIFEMTAQNSENIELIKGMLRRKVDVDEFEALEKRVALLETKLRPS